MKQLLALSLFLLPLVLVACTNNVAIHDKETISESTIRDDTEYVDVIENTEYLLRVGDDGLDHVGLPVAWLDKMTTYEPSYVEFVLNWETDTDTIVYPYLGVPYMGVACDGTWLRLWSLDDYSGKEIWVDLSRQITISYNSITNESCIDYENDNNYKGVLWFLHPCLDKGSVYSFGELNKTDFNIITSLTTLTTSMGGQDSLNSLVPVGDVSNEDVSIDYVVSLDTNNLLGVGVAVMTDNNAIEEPLTIWASYTVYDLTNEHEKLTPPSVILDLCDNE